MSLLGDIAVGVLSAVRPAGLGRTVVQVGERPHQALVLYDVEGCPYCRPVREALTMLDLDADIRPCPIGGTRFTAELAAVAGDAAVPVLVDPNHGGVVSEADRIVRHLYRYYGATEAPSRLFGPATRLTSTAISQVRPRVGTHAVPSRAPAQPLQLWAFEACPYCRRVRERLTELELPYRLHTMGKGSPKRPDFLSRNGKLQFPYLEDPSTGAAMFESEAIVAYLDRTWGAVSG